MPDLRYALAYAYSYTVGLAVLAYLWASFAAGGPQPLPNPTRILRANARRHAAALTRKDRP